MEKIRTKTSREAWREDKEDLRGPHEDVVDPFSEVTGYGADAMARVIVMAVTRDANV
jgi:hypothetical protein